MERKKAKQTDMKLACGPLTQIVHVLSLTRVKVHVVGRGFFLFFVIQDLKVRAHPSLTSPKLKSSSTRL